MKICLDAGHYGKYNQSPADKKYYESDMVWKLHLMLKKYLERYGIEVMTTREKQETDRGLYERGAASKGCDLFISVHSNAVGSGINEKTDYPVAYCAVNGSADKIGTCLTQCIENVMQTAQLARIEHRKGQNGDYYGVLRGASAVGTPALILEHSFHTNTAMTKWLLEDTNLERLAKAEADTIAMYYGIAMPDEKQEEGWKQAADGVRWWYQNADGSYCNNGWHWLREAAGGTWGWYLFDADGYMLTGYQTAPDGRKYFLCPDAGIHQGKCMVTDDQGALQIAEYDWQMKKYDC